MNVTREASELLSSLMARPWGQVTASVYETGRLVALAPRLPGHRERVAYLLSRQRPDGSWGAPDGYDLVPTLSATDALLGLEQSAGPRGAAAAARAGLAALHRILSGPLTLPDMPAVELIVPALIERVNAHGAGDPLPLPARMSSRSLDRVRQAVASGAPLPQKLLHALEVAGSTGSVRPTAIGTVGASPAATAAWLAAVESPEPSGEAPAAGPMTASQAVTASQTVAPSQTVAASQAVIAPQTVTAQQEVATPQEVIAPQQVTSPQAVGDPEGVTAPQGAAVPQGVNAPQTVAAPEGVGAPQTVIALSPEVVRVADAWAARNHLEAVVTRFGGPVPVGLPITVFERGWVLSWLARAGVPAPVPPEMTAELRAAIGPAGTPAGSGLPADADTTSVALHALALLGLPCEPDSLLAFDTGTHFCTWQGEDGFSVSVNAHALDALGAYAAARPDRAEAYAPLVARQAALLAERQRPDGCWDDRWHASPYYATLSCALALGEFGGPGHAEAVRGAREWVLSTQRADGSWGRWGGTAEETAYALQTLLLPVSLDSGRDEEAVRNGYAFLQQATDMYDYPPLWHDKDLYTPIAVVRAAILAALHLKPSL